MITITALPSRLISIGRRGENEHRRVAFDISEYLAQYPDATFGLIHSPSGMTAYPVATVAVENDTLIWTVTSSDVTSEGQGRCELIVRQGDTIAKSIIYMTQVLPVLDEAGEAPEPWESWQSQMIGIAADVDASADRAEAASEAVQNMGATATTLEPGADVTVTKSTNPETGAVTLAFGIPTGPQGPAGEPGKDGAAGRDGVSPTASATQTAEGAVITVTDAAGTTTATLTNGRDGTDGQPGAAGVDGVSPTVTVTDITGGHRVTITDASGVHSFDVTDGSEGQRGPAGEDGSAGADGHTPVITANKSGTVTTISVDGTGVATINDGASGTDGDDGVTFTPVVSSAGVISWTNDGGRQNPNPVDLTAGVSGAVSDWLDDHVDPATGYVIDDTLSVAGAAADAAKVGDLKSAVTNRTAGVLVSSGEGDLDIADPLGNVLVRLANGEIQTKLFDSSALKPLNEDGGTADLDVADIYGNVLARFDGGNVETKNFRGFKYVTFRSALANYNGQQLTLTIGKPFRRGDRVIIHMERGAMPWDGGGAVSYYEGNTLIVDSSRVDCAWIEHTIMQDGTTISATYPASATGMSNGPVRLEVSLLGDIPIKPTVIKIKQDGSGDYTTLRGALDAIGTSANDVLNPYRVEIYPGTYNVMDDYSDEEIADAEYDITKFVGPLLLNGVWLVGMGNNPDEVVLNGVLDTDKWSAAIRGVVSTLNCQGTCGFENMTVLATNLRYCVHDDYYTQVGKPYRRVVRNCVFRAYGQMSYTTPITYGAGMKRTGATFLFENCDFGSCSGVHTDRVMFRQGIVHLINCKGTQFEAGDIEESENTEKTIYQLDNCCFDQLYQHYWGDQPYTHAHVEICGSSKNMIYAVPDFALYKTGDVTMCPDLALSKGSVVEQWFQYYRPRWRAATSLKTAGGVVIGTDGTDCYIQTSGYIPTNLVGISTCSVGDYVGMVNGVAAVVQSADDAFGIVATKDTDGNGHIRLNWR